MNRHLREEELIARAFDLDEPRAAARVRRHLESCPECLARQAALVERLDQLRLLQEPVAAPESLIADTVRRVRMAQLPGAARPWYYRWGILAASAAASLLFLFGLPVVTRWGRPAPAALPVVFEPQVVSEGVGGVEVSLAREPDALDALEPLPAAGVAPPPVDVSSEVAELAAHNAPAEQEMVADARRPPPLEITMVPTGVVVALRPLAGDRAAPASPVLESPSSPALAATPAARRGAPGGRQLVISAAAVAPERPTVRMAFPEEGARGVAGPGGILEYFSSSGGLRLRNRGAASVQVQVDGAASKLVEIAAGAETNLIRGPQ